ncbi:metallopeptidase family protein [Rhodococcus sp. ABRD24]|uniref:metallopeptidase family protein n=1 Tax=Rhodococcus sp. ABRD24 TaxID=2507582 RepID=UPI00103B2A57|nr:metallopeptidase family protein [Rhodococcus sp. ABRD24]QBJ95340.1 metallopeptidase family protein [Rhodococcus sp. ABRD24]
MSRARRPRPLTSRSVSRRGRGIRGPLLPPDLPAARTRAEKFDLLVLRAFEPIDGRWHDRLTKLDIAVDDVPRIRALDPDSVNWPPEVVADGPVPLSRLIPAGIDRHGTATRARIVLFRRPIELRAKGVEDLEDLVCDVLVQQVSTYLGVDPELIDPEFPGTDE